MVAGNFGKGVRDDSSVIALLEPLHAGYSNGRITTGLAKGPFGEVIKPYAVS